MARCQIYGQISMGFPMAMSWVGNAMVVFMG